jgi:transcriptional regulator with XRE-family HTH domain
MGKKKRSSKLLAARELFHVKLEDALAARKVSRPELARLMGVSDDMVTRWLTAGPKGRIPNGIYLGWLLQLLRLPPEDLVGPAPAGPVHPIAPDIERHADALEETARRTWAAAQALRGLPPE